MKRYYTNMDNVSTEKAWKQFRRWRAERKVRLKQKDYSYVVPQVKPDLARLHNNDGALAITWIGHSTFLLQMGGLNIVTDPVWAESMAMEKRLSPPGIPIDQMPPVDVILISHSHYDHLHMGSLRKLVSPRTLLVVPGGLKAKMVRKGFPQTVELEWWMELMIGSVRVTFVPAQHWTRRTLADMNRSHWGGYVLEQLDFEAVGTGERPPAKETVYFAGDSGYFRGFREIGRRFAIDVALMPIGAYEPEWFMSRQHVTPEEALQAFEDVGAKLMIPMHYGAFKLADDTPKEALDRLEAERLRRSLDESQVRLLALGETWRGGE
ncbi:MBL fold metallo-hydrolase [Paenibacillus thiaminolyticus]|uniref:MBL fold metallo-hydrolase n=1 Tax=Paenibacillus thiaminolyticus TaxID=49283 RepID=A0AAP9J0X3_PANTH|nr:MBL fold metallo-hydrolase [Paenibacillus thiaminolyticus]MCY9537742.1 MBL fold metallo-hydrolase [Paenibacillus thiaminolyticus]MCY9600299.1 MBL fold metallo-hydrolase [Paenibacillus thiaminolyticus]MCY9607371.1 MBL fold metallo-hydrolase [Paenibacillus thiaminolyticus]MCY9613886.1 MBL fold metallo-hydrolase [Paenibacillus thiaminolyticus]MCY9617891.1 MBL fold metallo-hydrolase [Paenibacillus thiaminolyticus]